MKNGASADGASNASTARGGAMRCVYLTYDGLLDPLGQSQVLPYIRHLVAVGHSFTIVSYEKDDCSADDVARLERELSDIRVEWMHLPFKHGKIEFIRRFLSGIRLLRKICRRVRPDLIHLRGMMSAVICQFACLRVPHLYDFRSFALGEWTEFGKIRMGSLGYRILRRIDQRAVEAACGLVVLEKSAEALLRRTYRVPDVPLKVIRTCTDVARYRVKTLYHAALSEPIRFVYLGGARRPAYRPDLALRLVAQFLQTGINCRIDFINERDHADILEAIDEVKFPRERVELLKVAHRDIPRALGTYDCGLVFYDKSFWRRVCSPTKFGECLAAGVPSIAFEGVDILEELAITTKCVAIVRSEDFSSSMTKERVEELVSFIRAPDAPVVCQELARREFSMEMAGRLYTELYAEIAASR